MLEWYSVKKVVLTINVWISRVFLTSKTDLIFFFIFMLSIPSIFRLMYSVFSPFKCTILIIQIYLRCISNIFRYKCNIFRENTMTVLKTNCYWKAIIYKALLSVVGSFLMLSFYFTLYMISWQLIYLTDIIEPNFCMVLGNFSLQFLRLLITFAYWA
jgi:hypothetical protein